MKTVSWGGAEYDNTLYEAQIELNNFQKHGSSYEELSHTIDYNSD
jgi:hypothetical protein